MLLKELDRWPTEIVVLQIMDIMTAALESKLQHRIATDLFHGRGRQFVAHHFVIENLITMVRVWSFPRAWAIG